ncbi:hypothetical protein CHGG_06846 [Chaetomium globosum CBS 148.51]|uniref:ADP-ribosylation factor n=1 Tax=Chaetomium globosum (strain ATCC 6205 / CBS 148.51 / DSM 1962 / NBRC 6347 / NRRL 1970) TaxID=306901 RepID=Q2GYV8_CHAGB|nr:uncharacterized protein CHGG_06846 [Chaetomium globosum CBS 148.51]EAQ85593.1 hypothetical protein CHGG_06846 [Chaetomium globosum CBS 148.51]
MGASMSISSLFGKLFGSKEVRILMLGLDAAGKTTILYKLKLNQTMTTIPTVGFNVEAFTYKNIKFNMWDVGGQDKIRPLWRHYYSDVKTELHRILNDLEMSDCLLLVFANKQDLKGAMDCQTITTKLELSKLGERPWFVQPAIATEGEGLTEGFGWLSENIKKTPKYSGK